jgi:hypothetical protein
MDHGALIQKTSLLNAGCRVAVDSCVLMFLNRLQLLRDYNAVLSIQLTSAVYNEIMKYPNNGKYIEDISTYKELFSHCIHEINIVNSKARMPRGLSVADVSIVGLYYAARLDGIVTDDKALCGFCRTHAIAYINTPLVLFLLMLHGRYTYAAYRRHLQAVFAMGRYNHFVLAYMNALQAEYLQSFVNVR